MRKSSPHCKQESAGTTHALRFEAGQAVVFDGDSNTNRRGGPGLTDWPYLRMMGWDKSWADIFAELMFCWHPELRLKMVNVAVGGSKSSDLLERFDTYVKPHKPNWVFVTMGGNDIHGLTAEETKRNAAEYIRRVQECGGNVVFLIDFQPAPHCSPGEVTQLPRRQERYAMIRAAALENNAFAIDVGTGLKEKAEELARQWDGHTVYTDADSHYNAIGGTIIAGEVLKSLGYAR